MKKLLMIVAVVMIAGIYGVTMEQGHSQTVQVKAIPSAQPCQIGYVTLQGGCYGIGGAGGGGVHGTVRD